MRPLFEACLLKLVKILFIFYLNTQLSIQQCPFNKNRIGAKRSELPQVILEQS